MNKNYKKFYNVVKVLQCSLMIYVLNQQQQKRKKLIKYQNTKNL